MNTPRSEKSLTALLASAKSESPSFVENDVLDALNQRSVNSANAPELSWTKPLRWLSAGVLVSSVIAVTMFTVNRNSERENASATEAQTLTSQSSQVLSATQHSPSAFDSPAAESSEQITQATQLQQRTVVSTTKVQLHNNNSTSSRVTKMKTLLPGTQSSIVFPSDVIAYDIPKRSDSTTKLNGMGGIVWTDSLYATHIVLADRSHGNMSIEAPKISVTVDAKKSLEGDALFEKLGIVRRNKDTVVLTGWDTETSPHKFSQIELVDNSVARSSYYHDSIPGSTQPKHPFIFPMYVVNKNGTVINFGVMQLPVSKSFDIEEVLSLNHEDSLLRLIRIYRDEAKTQGLRFWLRPTSSVSLDAGRGLRKSIETMDGVTYLTVELQWTATERSEQFRRENERFKNIRMMYKDSCITVCIHPNGVDPIFLLYYPSKELLDMLPATVALQLRAEQGNADALRELRDSYKGCRYMSFCTTSSGAIEDTEILGSMSGDTRVRIALKEPRTLRIALYDIAGRLVSEIDKGSAFVSGFSTVPLRVQSADRSVGFYLLVITSDAGEKVSQRVVLGE